MSVLNIFSISRSFVTATLIYGYVSNVFRFACFFFLSFSLTIFPASHPTVLAFGFRPNCLFCLTLFNVHFCFIFSISLFFVLLYVLHFRTVSVNVFNSFVAFDERT